jgi:transcriptional regulator with XRE-family HTH domain
MKHITQAPPPVNATFAAHLRCCRIQRDLSAAELARRSHLPRSMISFLEHGRIVCGPIVREKLVAALRLRGCEREEFEQKAAATTVRGRGATDERAMMKIISNALGAAASVRSCRSEVVVARRVHDLVVEMKDGTWFSIELKMLRQKPRKQ